MAVKAIPDGYHSITPGMNVKECDKAIEFLRKAFGGEERARHVGPGGKIVHAEVKIGDSIVMLSEAAQQAPYTVHAMLYVTDCDAVFKRAIDAGATAKQPPTDMFYGDRGARVVDPFGNDWFVATHKEDVAPEELEKRMKAMMSGGKPS
jgi:PhnB protein